MATQQNLQLSTDPSKINQYEADPKTLETYHSSLEDQLKALEMRYENPNWFKVAAAFLKPQLGGFSASLGSAAESLGENVEAGRANQLPVAQMRAQLAASKLATESNVKQNQAFQAWKATGKPMDATTYANVIGYNPASPIAKAAKGYLDAAQQTLGMKVTAAEAAGKDPLMQVDEWIRLELNPNADPKVLEAKTKAAQEAISASKPPQIDQAQWNGMSRYQQMEASLEYAKQQREQGMTEEQKYRQQAVSAQDRLPLLSSIRSLALGVGLPSVKTSDGKEIDGQQQMEQMLGIFKGSNPLDVFARAASDKNALGIMAELEKYAAQFKAVQPAAYDHFQKLVKLLAENQMTIRNASLNPTDASMLLQQTGQPNIGNTQRSLVTLVDLIGHAEEHAIDRYRYATEKGVQQRLLPFNQGWNDIQRKYQEEHNRIATSSPTLSKPNWYNPAGSLSQYVNAALPQSNQAAVNPAGSQAAGPSVQTSRSEERTMPDGTVLVRDPNTRRWTKKGG